MIYSIVHKKGNGGAEKQAAMFVDMDSNNRVLCETREVAKISLNASDRIIIWTPVSLLSSRKLLLIFLTQRRKIILGFRSSYRIKGRLFFIRLVQFFLFVYSPYLLSNVRKEALYFPFNLIPAKKFIYVRNIVENVVSQSNLKGSPVIVYLGRFEVEKGIIELMALWQRTFPALKLVGKGSIDLENSKSNIRLCGHNPNFWKEWEKDPYPLCIVLPSKREEGTPNVVLEALARGIPVIIRDVKEHRIFPDGLVTFCDFKSAKSLKIAIDHSFSNLLKNKDERMSWISKWRIESQEDLERLNEIFL